MTTSSFPPLSGAIANAESWTRYLSVPRNGAAARRPEEIAASVESQVSVGVHLGESLPLVWRLTFDTLLRPGAESWSTVSELEAIRQEIRRLFFTVREAMDSFRNLAESLQGVTGRLPARMGQLLEVIEAARQLEDQVFRDWPSFAEPLPAPDFAASLPVEESLAAILGIHVDQARQRLEARRQELNAKRG